MIDEMEAMLLGPSLRAINMKMQPYLHYLVPLPEVGKQEQAQGQGQEGQQGGWKTVGPGAGGGGGDGPGSSTEGAAAGQQLVLGCNREEMKMMMLEVLREWQQQQQQLQVVRHLTKPFEMGDEMCMSDLPSPCSGPVGSSDQGGSGRIKSTSRGEGISIKEPSVTKTERVTGAEAYLTCSEEGAGATPSGSEEGGAGEGQEKEERFEEGHWDEGADVGPVRDHAAL